VKRLISSGPQVWTPLIAAWVAAIAAVLLWAARTPTDALRTQLTTLQFWSLEACFIAVGAAAFMIAGEVRNLGRGHWRRVAILGAAAVALTVFVAPRTNRIYYDEQIYQGIGHNMADLRRAQMCLDGTVEYGRLDCVLGAYNKQPNAYPHLLSVVYRIGGAGPGSAFALNALAAALTVFAVYFIVLLLFDDATSALFAGAVMALIPQQLLWSATAAVEPLASASCALAVAAAALFVRTRSDGALVAVTVLTAYALQFRPESLLILSIVLAVVITRAPNELGKPRFWLAGLLGLALIAVHVGHLFAVRNEGWGTTEARFSLGYVLPNLSVNGPFYVADERFPAIFTALAVIGAMGAAVALTRLVMVGYFLAFFAVGLLFYAGSYNYGADVRYSLMTYPPLAVLAGLGAGWVVARLGEHLGPTIARRAAIAGLAFQFLWYAPLVRATTDEAWAARSDVEFAATTAKDLPANAFVLTHNPGMFHLWGVNAGQMFLAADNPARLQQLTTRYAGGVFLHWNFWCNVSDPSQQALCDKVRAMAPTEVLRERRERDQWFAFLKMGPPAVVPHPWEGAGQSR
jgi:hypothetical protein